MRHLAAVLAASALLAGCGVVSKLESRKVLAAVVLRTPSVNAAGAALPVVDVGGVTTAQLFFGERQDSPTQPPTALDGASVTLAWAGSASGSVQLQRAAPGWYQAAGGIAYAPGLAYTFTVAYQGETFSATATAPEPPRIKELVGAPTPGVFPPFPSPTFYAAFDHQAVSRDGTDVAFYAVADPLASGGGVTCSNQPFGDAAAMVALLLDPSPFEAPSFTLYRSDRTTVAAQQCFPRAGTYVVTLTAARLGAVSSNLFLGSGVLAGASDAGVLVLQ